MTTKGEKRLAYTVLVMPAVAIYLAVVAFPTIYSILLSLTDYNGGQIFGNPNIHFVGTKSYVWMFTEPAHNFYLALKNNMLIVGVSVFGQLPLGFLLAYILAQKLIRRGTRFFQTMIYLPHVISPIIIGVLFNAIIYGRNSVLMEIRKFFDPTAVYTLPSNPMIPVLTVILFMYVGFYLVIFLANMQRIDPAVIEAARIDGAKEYRILWHIMLPALSGVIITTAILAISGSLKTFDLLYGMTQGGPAGQTRVLSLYMYQSAFQGAPNYPLANAISTVMVLISLALSLIVNGLGKVFKGEV